MIMLARINQFWLLALLIQIGRTYHSIISVQQCVQTIAPASKSSNVLHFHNDIIR